MTFKDCDVKFCVDCIACKRMYNGEYMCEYFSTPEKTYKVYFYKRACRMCSEQKPEKPEVEEVEFDPTRNAFVV